MVMAATTVITIGRQYGNGGREIGMKLAQILGMGRNGTIITAKFFWLFFRLIRLSDKSWQKRIPALLHALADFNAFSVFIQIWTNEFAVSKPSWKER